MRRSASGNLLVLSSREYLAKLHRGVTLILTAITLQLCLVVGAIIVVVTGLWAGTSTLAIDLVSIAIEGLGLWGWWLFSAPDPVVTGADAGDRPRIVVRVALIIGAATLVFNTFLQTVPGVQTDMTFIIVVATVEIVNVAAQVVKFFAAMLYIRWLAPRLPDTRVHDRARRLMWLGPLLMTVGLLILIGPLIALGLYWSMLNWVRRDLREIREENARRYGVGAVTLET